MKQEREAQKTQQVTQNYRAGKSQQTSWLSFIELDKAVVCVIRLASFLRLWFQCVFSLMPSCNTYHLTWISLTLDVGYLFRAAPAKHSRCSLPWMRIGLSSQPSLLTVNME